MYSRAHLLIQRDYEQLLTSKPWGIEAHPLKEDSMFEWSAKVLGLKGTAWEGGIFRVYMRFDEYYNDRPPEVCFHTIPFHPNVDMITGKPCIDFLDDITQWKTYSFMTVLLAVQSMLSNPVMEHAVNTDAINLLLNSPHAYKQMVQDCIIASQRVEAGLSPHHEEDVQSVTMNNKNEQDKVPATAVRKKAQISFEDYHQTWTGIATSKLNTEIENPLIDLIEDHPSLVAAHYGISSDQLQLQMEKQMQEHNKLMYGKFKSHAGQSENDLRRSKLDEISKMRKIYLQPRTPKKNKVTLTTEELRSMSRQDVSPTMEPWEQEVDDLVAWTNKLDTELL